MFPKPVREKLVLHSHFDLINKLGLAGAAANERNLNELTGVKVMSYSAHSIDELKYPPIEAKYYFLSPIWDSLSKKGYKATLNHDDIRAFLYRTDKEVIALGGVTDEKLGELIRMGFDGYAMLGNIWNDQYSFT